MSKHPGLPGPGKLPLPSPRSPLDLDERILRAARERAPTPRRQVQPWWIGGAATASVLVIAVMLVMPEQPAPEFNTEQGISPAAMFTPSSRTTSSASDVQMERPSSEAQRSIIPQKNAVRSQISADEARGMASKKMMSDAAPATITRARYSAVADVTTEMADSEINPGQLSERLQALVALMDGGEEEEARRQYDALRENCQACDLPLTLEQALERHWDPAP